MKKLTDFITRTANKVETTSVLRLLYFLAIIIMLLLLNIFTDGQQIAFVYNEF